MASRVKVKRQPKTPATVQTESQLCAMKRTVVSTRSHWMLIDQTSRNGFEIVIASQRNGEAASETLHIPRRTFAKFARWFESGQWPVKLVRQK